MADYDEPGSLRRDPRCRAPVPLPRDAHLLGLACLALYLYVSAQQLDSIEKRILNTAFLFSRVIEHIQLAVVSTVIVVVLAVTTGILLTRFAPAGCRRS